MAFFKTLFHNQTFYGPISGIHPWEQPNWSLDHLQPHWVYMGYYHQSEGGGPAENWWELSYRYALHN